MRPAVVQVCKYIDIPLVSGGSFLWALSCSCGLFLAPLAAPHTWHQPGALDKVFCSCIPKPFLSACFFPLQQHINNLTLLSMNRPPQAHTKALLQKLRDNIPGLVLRTTFIAGGCRSVQHAPNMPAEL